MHILVGMSIRVLDDWSDPKIAYVGDKVELSCKFESQVESEFIAFFFLEILYSE